MRTILVMAALLAASWTAASANEGHDRRIDEAAARIVASRIGALRGSFSAHEAPVFVIAAEGQVTTPIRHWRGGWHHGMARAREAMPVTQLSY